VVRHSQRRFVISERSPLWPAELDHIRLDTDTLASMVDFYRSALGMRPSDLGDGTVLMQAPRRRLVIGPGKRGAQPYMANLPDSDRVRRANVAGCRRP
jgi:hypothetical protein